MRNPRPSDPRAHHTSPLNKLHAMFRRASLCVLLLATCWCVSLSLSIAHASPSSPASAAPSASAGEFSGVFIPNITESAADFAAAWLVHKSHLFAVYASINASTNMAGVSFAVTRPKHADGTTVMTRDYMDFMVEHLSATSNQIPQGNRDLFQEATRKLQRTVKTLRERVLSFNETFTDREDARVQRTVAVLVYAGQSFSARNNDLQSAIRVPFFQATFWSVFRHFPNVVVFVANEEDAQAVRWMDIPYWRLVTLPVPLDHLNRSVALPRHSILSVVDHLRAGTDYHGMDYVYFTEGDQILHMRRMVDLFDTIDNSDGLFVVAPHRMQTLPLKQDYPDNLHHVYAKDSFLDIPSVTVIEEDLFRTHGSCCDDGVYRVAPCKGWWYQCKDWGIKDMVPWLKFGSSGLTMPPATEHRRSCSYSSGTRLCPLPANCQVRKPVRSPIDGRRAENKDLCGTIPLVKYLGPPIVMFNGTSNSSVLHELHLKDQKIHQLEEQVKRMKKKLRSATIKASTDH